MTATKGRSRALGINDHEALKTMFAQRLQYALDMRDENASSLASKTGMAHSTINRYLNSQKLPNMTTLRVIVAQLNVSCDWLCVVGPQDRNEINNDIRTIVKANGVKGVC